MDERLPPADPAGSIPEAGRPRRRGAGAGFRYALATVVIAVLLVALALASLTLLFRSGNPVLATQILAAINRAVGTDSTRFTSDRVYGTLLRGAVLENPRLIVRTRDGEVTWARARSLRVEYDLVALALGRSQDLRVEVDRPRIDLVHDRRGELVLPRFAKRPARKDRPETRVAITLRDGGFSIDRWDVRFGDIGGHATLTLAPGRSLLRLDRLVGVSETSGRPGRLQLSGDLRIESGILRADPLEIALGRSRFTTRTDWDLAEARVQEGTLTLHPLEVREFFRSLEIQSADGTLRGEVTFAGTPTAGEARACLEGTYAGEPIDTLVLLTRFRPGAVDVSGLRLRIRRSEVTGSGILDTRGALTADLVFRGVNPAVLPWWKSPENTPSGSLQGRARVVARRARPRPDATFAVTFEPSRLGKLDIERGFARLHLTPAGASSVDSSWIESPGARLAVRGAVGADHSLHGTIQGTLRDLSRLNELLGPVPAAAGSGRLEARIAGTTDAPTFVAQAHLFDGELRNGVHGDTVTIEAQGRVRPRLDLVADIGVRGLRAGTHRLGNVDATLSGGSTLRIARYRQAIGDTSLTLQGTVTFAEEGIAATVDSLRLIAGEHEVRNRRPIQITSAGERVHVRELSLELDPGTLEADLDWNPERGTLDARATVAGLDLSRVPELQRRDTRFAGLLRGDILASGPMRDPDLSLRVEVVEPTVGEFAGDTLLLDLDYTPGLLQLERATWIAGTSRLAVAGSMRPQVTLGDWWRALGRRDRSWASRATLAISARADSFDLSLLAPMDSSLRTLDGTVFAVAQVGGTAEAPVLNLTASAPTIRYRGVEGSISAADLHYEARRLTVTRFELRQEDAVSNVRGEIPIDLSLVADERLPKDLPVSLQVDVPNGNLSIARLLLPFIGYSAGRFTATAEVSGTLGNPHVTGTLRIADGRFRAAGRDEVVERIALDATFDQERLTVTRAVGFQGKRGKVTASGWWKWPTAPPPRGEPPAYGPRGAYEFHVQGNEFTVTDRENYLIRLNGTFDIVNARHPSGAPVPWITGRAVVTKGELTLDLAQAPGEPREPLPFMYYITVSIPGNFFYRNLDAEVELESDGDLIFKNEGRGDLALGILEVKSGKYYVLTREFRNLQGTVNFNSPDRIDPQVNIVGETSLPSSGRDEEHVVYLALTDRVSRLKVSVYDDQGTSPNDLWKALAFGQFVRGYDVATGTRSSGADATGVALPISNYLFQNVERWIGSTGFIDTIDLRGSAGTATTEESNGGPISVVGVGKYVTPELYFKYSRDFSGQAEEQINADYRVTRHLIIKGQQIKPSDPNKPQEYNLDLKIRLEY